MHPFYFLYNCLLKLEWLSRIKKIYLSNIKEIIMDDKEQKWQ